MSSGSKTTLAAAAVLLGTAYAVSPGITRPEPVRLEAPAVADGVPAPAPAADPRTLRVCADPNNLPFSDERADGFENRIADVVARDLGRQVRYYWQPQRRGFIRTALDAGRCDVVIGMPGASSRVRTTRPYYRSTFAFVTRRDRQRPIASFDDPRLRRLRIGVQVTGTDSPPPGQALAARHLLDQTRGYTVFGDYSRPGPGRTIVDAVAAGEVDVAVVWGPLAGYFASRERVPLDVVPVRPAVDPGGLPFAFDIAMGVRRADAALAAELDAAIDRRRSEIAAILQRYQVPVAEPGGRRTGAVRGEG